MPRTASTSSNRTTRAKTPARTTRKQSKDAFAILMEDHKRVQKMFKQFEKMDREDGEAMRELVETACRELELHATLEEELFYPMLRESLDDERMEMLEEAEIEHGTAKQLMAALRELQPDDPKYAATFTVLGEYVKHHVEEEESEIFKQAKKAKIDAQSLGEEIQSRRMQMESGGAMDEDEDGGVRNEAGVKEMDVEDEEDMEPAQPRRRSR